MQYTGLNHDILVQGGMMLFLVYVLWNLAAFILVMIDKRRACSGGRRIRERNFFILAFLFGAAGVLLGMYVFRHKTRHVSFVIGIPVLFLLNLAGCYILQFMPCAGLIWKLNK